MDEYKTKERKREINDLTRFDNLLISSGQKGEDIIQTTELQRITN